MIKLIAIFYLSVMSISAASAQSSVKPSITEANSEFVYKYLLGEIAGQRGDLSLASQLFIDLAKKTRDPRLAERATEAAAYGRHQRLALDAATLWAELDPNSLKAQQAASQMMISTGNMKSAVPHIKELLSKEGIRATTFLYLNELLRNQQDKKAVLTTIKELAQPYPESAESHFSVAQAAWVAQDIGAAESAIRKASQLRPDWEVCAQMQGQILAKQSPEKALDLYKAFLNKNPTANNVRMSYAKLLVSLKYYADAKPEFVKLIELEKDNPDTNAVVGLLSLEANELDMAEQYLQQSLRNDFKDPEKIYMYLGTIAGRKKNESKALEWYARIPKSNQHYLEAQLATANIIAHTKNTNVAISMLASLTELSSKQEVAVAQAQANLLTQDKRHQEAFELIKKTINAIPNTPQLIYDYAMAAERIGKLELMEHELRKVIQLQPDFPAAYNALGYSFADRDTNLKEAKTLIETAYKLSPSDHYILDSLGWVEYRLGNYGVAAEHLRKAYSIQEDPEISAHLGEVLWKQGLQEEAKNIWGKALKEFPENSILVITSKKFNS